MSTPAEEKPYSVVVSAQPTGACQISSCGRSSVEVANALDSAREYARLLLDNDAARTSSRILITEKCSLCDGTQQVWGKKARVRPCVAKACVAGEGEIRVVHDETVSREQGSVVVVDPIPAPARGGEKIGTKKLTVRLPKKDAVPQLAFDVDGKDVPLSELIEAYRLLTAREMEPLLEAARDGKAVTLRDGDGKHTFAVELEASVTVGEVTVGVNEKKDVQINLFDENAADEITDADHPKVAQASLFNRRVLHGF